ncbi:molybdate ABC transporter substrate-binding protein [Eubacterium multiforme]|uniref:Molybdate transport system substrate-binding protein n=1 Tax=Eubacterium multiforme TaxID=83339 RepID=A0ABT9UTX0_9FIRM|nr:molybdate ABC transporter substrate-binding protein [Eubacterium multiforme]MDQ0149746.1 molybdate transport system substrate-binding protein [Eubacterium multiforme]
MSIKKMTSIMLAICVIVFSFIGCTNKAETASSNKTENKQPSNKTLVVYSGAGLKKPMGEIAKNFQKETGVKVEYIFAGSTQLLSQLETSGKGDVFIVGSKNAYDAAKKKNLVEDCKEVAYHTPAIITKKGNPKNIKTLKDLQKDGVKVILGDEKANAIGKTTQKIIEKNKLDGIKKNVVAKVPTINEVTMHVVDGKADAAIATKDSVYKNDKIDVIEIPEKQNVNQILPISAVKSSKEKEMANKFVEYVSSDKGKTIFEKHGFKPVK